MNFFFHETGAGKFELARQPYTESAWELLFNGEFMDSFPSPFQAARSVRKAVNIKDPRLLPPTDLYKWSARGWKFSHGDSSCMVVLGAPRPNGHRGPPEGENTNFADLILHHLYPDGCL